MPTKKQLDNLKNGKATRLREMAKKAGRHPVKHAAA